MATSKRKLVASVLAGFVIMSGCGPMPDTAPTAPGSPQIEVAETALPSATPATPEAGAITFGDLADRVGAAWPTIATYRVTFTGSAMSGPVGAGTPVTRPEATPGTPPPPRSRAAYTTVREVVAPDRQRQTVSGLGADDHEAVAIGENLFVRGNIVERIAPGASKTDWIALDPTLLPDGALLLQLLGGLPEPPGAPFATLPDRLREQEVRDVEVVEFDGRKCTVYGAADTIPATGMRVDYTIALDADAVPCFVETGAGGVTHGRDEYTDINAELTIEPPAAATPVSIPPALATPIAHD